MIFKRKKEGGGQLCAVDVPRILGCGSDNLGFSLCFGVKFLESEGAAFSLPFIWSVAPGESVNLPVPLLLPRKRRRIWFCRFHWNERNSVYTDVSWAQLYPEPIFLHFCSLPAPLGSGWDGGSDGKVELCLGCVVSAWCGLVSVSLSLCGGK